MHTSLVILFFTCLALIAHWQVIGAWETAKTEPEPETPPKWWLDEIERMERELLPLGKDDE